MKYSSNFTEAAGLNGPLTLATLRPEQNRCLNTADAAAFLGFAKSQINKLRLSGTLPAVIVGPKCIRFRLSDLIEYRDSLLHGGNGRPAKGKVPAAVSAAHATNAAKANKARWDRVRNAKAQKAGLPGGLCAALAKVAAELHTEAV